jgi:type IV pilus assembly protein PilO
MEKLIEQIAKAPLGLKVAVVAAAVVVLTALNYFVMALPWGDSISEIESKIVRADAEQKRLAADLAYKTGIANDLNRFRHEREVLEQRLNEALAELPEDKKIEDILQAFQDRAQKSGLEIVSIEPKEQQPEGFYARVPIAMQVSGTFHEVATFFDALGHMRRIVNVGNIALDTPKDTGGKVVLSGKFTATTFMFLDPKAAAAAAAAKKAKGGK